MLILAVALQQQQLPEVHHYSLADQFCLNMALQHRNIAFVSVGRRCHHKSLRLELTTSIPSAATNAMCAPSPGSTSPRPTANRSERAKRKEGGAQETK
jgi:hypothetical protein